MPCGSRVVFNCCSILMSMPAAQGQEGRPHRGMPERQTNREGARSCRHLPDSRRLAVRIHCPPPPVRLRTCSFPSGAGRELNHFPQAPGARSARLATRHAARCAGARSGPAVRPTLLPPPCRVPGAARRGAARGRALRTCGPGGRRGDADDAARSPSPPPGAERAGEKWGCFFLSFNGGRELNHFPQAPGAHSVRLATRLRARRSRAVRAAAQPGPCHGRRLAGWRARLLISRARPCGRARPAPWCGGGRGRRGPASRHAK